MRQPKWNQYEAAILLEAAISVNEGKEKRTKAISYVSQYLRKMAANQGLKIDEVYRNVNGITFQLQSMEVSAFGKVSALKNYGTKLFDDIVKLRISNPNEYTKILEEAHCMIDSDGFMNKTGLEPVLITNGAAKQEQHFREWLIKSGKKESTVNWIIDCFHKVSQYAQEKKKTSCSIWENTSPIEYNTIVNSLLSFKFFRVLHRDLHSFLQKNGRLYFDFLKSQAVPEKRILKDETNIFDISEYIVSDKDRRLVELYPHLFGKIYQNLKQNDKHAYLIPEQIQKHSAGNYDESADILKNASWSEKLGTGYILGRNNNVGIDTSIHIIIGPAFEEPTRVEDVLNSVFKRGYRPDSIMDRKRFQNIYEEKFKCKISDNELLRQVQSVCFLFDGRYFLPKALTDKSSANKIADYVQNYFADKDILFYSVLYKVFKDSFNSMVYSAEMFSEYLKTSLSGTPLYYQKEYFSYKYDAKPDISSEVGNFLIEADKPCSYDEIHTALSHIDPSGIYNVIHYNHPELLGNSKRDYFHIDAAHITLSNKTTIYELCDALLKNSKYITCNEIIDNLERKDIELYDKLTVKFSILGIRRILSYYLSEKYDVNTGVIARKGEKMAIADVFADYAETHNKFTVTDIQNLSEYTGTVPYWDTVCTHATRISKDDFVSDNSIEFSIEAIDSAIAFYCANYLPLKDIDDFMRFPVCSYPWNIYLLQQYVYRFSKNFKLAFLGFAKGNACGLIVYKQSQFEDFDSIVVHALSLTNINTKDKALDYLCEKGFISDRRYKKTDALLKLAIVMRQKNKEL